MTADDIYKLARKFEAYPDGGKIPTLRGTGIVEFANALLVQHEQEKRPGYHFFDRVGGTIAPLDAGATGRIAS